jgi:peptidyl-prolyl cis-trans isomerase SurA
MRKGIWKTFAAPALVLGLLPAVAPAAAAQQVVDRVVARIGSDIITHSDLAELGRFQQLMDGKVRSSSDRLKELAEQWIVAHEASLSGFTKPTAKDVDKATADLSARFGSAQAFQNRLKQLALSEDDVRQMLGRQLFLTRYLDYRFRPEVQVGEEQVEAYYQKTLVPQLQQKGQSVPPLDRVEDQVRELLVQQDINRRAVQWLDRMEERWKVERVEGNAFQ